ncbi:hypothetical protein LG634_31365 [Streptomyces bambusae]|uniref:hypothetical protein n=1 Tax=Streptomyces bambusae TaxID=1550616 RepID=UPI001CFF6B67|nr:hypothetical protein [Streptomyces bambusae]MCB5169297.1 hypothetical protein [Streptomyces bambusae]
MSGGDVPFGVLLAAFWVVASLAWLSAGRRRGPLAITAGVTAAQGALHLLFSRTESLPPAATGNLPGHHGGHGPHTGHGSATGDLAGSAGDMAGMAGDMAGMAGHGTLGMTAAHGIAALLCALWLARGEAAVFRLARAVRTLGALAAQPLLRALALLRTVPGVPAARTPRPRPHTPPRRLRGAVPAHAVVRRGPPLRQVLRTTAPGRPARA